MIPQKLTSKKIILAESRNGPARNEEELSKKEKKEEINKDASRVGDRDGAQLLREITVRSKDGDTEPGVVCETGSNGVNKEESEEENRAERTNLKEDVDGTNPTDVEKYLPGERMLKYT